MRQPPSARTQFRTRTGTACLLALALAATAVTGWTKVSGNGLSGLDLVVFLIAFTLAGLLGVFLLRRARETVLGPVLQLSFAVKRIVSVGNFRERVEKPNQVEFNPLAEQVNRLLSRIEQNERTASELQAQRERQAGHQAQAIQDQVRALEAERRAEREKQRQTIKELVLAKAAAEESSLAKSAFLFNMSHELRTPLNAIMGYSEILREEVGDDPTSQQAKDVDKILGAGKHLLSLINAVLDLSKIEAGRLELEPQTFDIAQLLHEVVSTSESLAAAQSNTLALEVAEGVGTMHSDPTKVRQVLLNLLGNACKFTTDGAITLDVTRERDMADWIIFEVKDTGIGLSPEDQAGLFREFKQGQAARSRPDKGTGLGLAISRALCHLMGGVISLESTLGVGSTFTVRLPAQLTTGRATLAARPSLRPLKTGDDPNLPAVLVIDHDAGSRELVQRATSRMGCRLIEATNASEGYRLAVIHEPVVIVLEVVLSGENGWGLLERLTHLNALGKLQVVVVSVSNDEARSQSLGAIAHLTKPVSAQQLFLRLKDVAANRSGDAPSATPSPSAAPVA